MRHGFTHGLLPGLLAALLPTLVCAQLGWKVSPGLWSGSVELGFDQVSQSSQSASGDSDSSSQNYRETVRLINSGFYVVDPRLFTGSAGVQIGLGQSRSSGAGDGSTNNIIGYDFSSAILSQKPYPMTIYANRNQRKSIQAFGGRTEGTSESRGFSARLKEDSIVNDWGLPWFSADFNVRQEHNQDTTTFLGRSSKRDETRRQVDFTARKGYTTADLNFRYQVSQQNNALLAQPSSQSHSADVAYSLDFGPGLNRHFDSGLSYSASGGLMPSTTLVGNSHVQLTHSRDLSTDYNYRFNYQDVGGQSALQQDVRATLAHQLYTNLNSNVSVSSSHYTVDSGVITSQNIALNQSYRHSLPRNGNLSLSWSGGRGLSTTALDVGNIWVNAEKHVAPAAFVSGNGFDLDHAFAVSSSITVMNVKGGGSVLLRAGEDYDIVTRGSRTRVEPKFGSLRVDPNDPLEVNYVYQVDPNSQHETRNLGFGAGVDYGWVRVSYQHQQSSQTPLKGEGLFLSSSRSDTVLMTMRGTVYDIASDASVSHSRSVSTERFNDVVETQTHFDLHGVWHDFDGVGSASFDQYRAVDLAYDRRALSSTLIWSARYDLNLVFAVSANDMQYLSTARQDSTRAARGSLSWNAGGGLTLVAFAEARNHSDGMADPETVLQLGARTFWLLGKLSVSSGVAYDRWVKGGSGSNGLRFDVSAVRSF